MKNEKEIVRIVNLFSDTIFKVALSNMQNKSTAEDILQNTLLKYMQCDKNFESDEHIKAWLIRVTINECKMIHRSFWKKKRIPLEDIYTFEVEDQQELFFAVMSLPKKYRLVIHLYYYEGYSIKEIGEMIGQKENTIASWLHRGRKMLKEKLEVEYEA